MSPPATPEERGPLSRRGGRRRLSLHGGAHARPGRDGAQDDRARDTRAHAETPRRPSRQPEPEQARMRLGDAQSSVYYDRRSSRASRARHPARSLTWLAVAGRATTANCDRPARHCAGPGGCVGHCRVRAEARVGT